MPSLHTYRLTAGDTLAGYRRHLSRLPAARQAKIRGFRQPVDALRCLLGELLVRSLLAERLGPAATWQEFQIGTQGKPYLAAHPDLHFNLSHSGAWVVCALDTQPLGVDVEEVRPTDLESLRLAFSPAERARLTPLPPAEQVHEMYAIWTLKEAYAKALGVGLSLEPTTVTVELGPPPSISPTLSTPWRLVAANLDADHALAVCHHDAGAALERRNVPALPTVASGLDRD